MLEQVGGKPTFHQTASFDSDSGMNQKKLNETGKNAPGTSSQAAKDHLNSAAAHTVQQAPPGKPSRVTRVSSLNSGLAASPRSVSLQMSPSVAAAAPPAIEARNPFDEPTETPPAPSTPQRSSATTPRSSPRSPPSVARAPATSAQRTLHRPAPVRRAYSDRANFLASFDPLSPAAGDVSSERAQKGLHPLLRDEGRADSAPHPLLSEKGGNGSDRSGSNIAGLSLGYKSTKSPPDTGRDRRTQSLCTPSEFSSVEPKTVEAELSALASALAQEKPRALNDVERAEESAMGARLTLGEDPSQSTGTKKSHRRKGSMGTNLNLKSMKKGLPGHRHSNHRRAATLDVGAMGGLMNDINDAGGGTIANKESKRSSGLIFGLSSPRNSSVRKMMLKGGDRSPGTPKSGKRSGSNTPKDKSGGCGTPDSAVPSGMINIGSIPPIPLEVPNLCMTAGGTFASACSYASAAPLWSSEQEPSAHQVDIPTNDEFLFHAKACAILDNYRVVDQNFDLGTLVGMSRLKLRQIMDPSFEGSGENLEGARRQGQEEGTTLVPSVHRPIVSSILSCIDDLVVEGFFHEMGGAGTDSSKHGDTEDDTGTRRDKAADDRIEVTVFSSQRRRQFVVVWRGTSALQAKPVRNRDLKAWKELTKSEAALKGKLHPECPVMVFPPFRNAYFGTGLEGRVFKLLDELSDQSPFCDVVMTGHSFGASLATIAAMRYATKQPMMRVLCQAFGCPRVGGADFRGMANSLPNLKIMRLEYGSDPFVCSPDGHCLTHVGHSIVVDSSVATFKAKNIKESGTTKDSVLVQAYRFDQNRPSGAKWFTGIVGHHGKVEKADHELRAYVKALEQTACLGLTWPLDYTGKINGEGIVKGSKKEKRLVV